MSLKDMRDELRALRKDAVKPVSRMRKADIAAELEKLRGRREETAPVASTPALKPKKQEAKVADVKKAKEAEFPVKPAAEEKKKASGKPSKKESVVGGAGAVGTKSKMTKDKLRKMLEEMASDEE